LLMLLVRLLCLMMNRFRRTLRREVML